MSFTEIPILLQYLFVTKLLILSASFVSLTSKTNFFFLWLYRFIQLFNTSSVLIGLEFVFLNLCLTVCENLLSLSTQEGPDLFILRVKSLSFLSARHKSANNRFLRSIKTDSRRQTGRQPSSSGCIRHEPPWWSGRWAITCGSSCSRPGCQSTQRKYAKYLSTTLRKLKMSGNNKNKWSER